MLLLDKLYHIISLTSCDANSFTATVSFNNDHEILKGHFPGNPIIPGACLIQITSELLSVHIQKPFSLVKSKKIKFTNSINPLIYNDVSFSFVVSGSDDAVEKKTCGITVQTNETIFAKISAEYEIDSPLQRL